MKIKMRKLHQVVLTVVMNTTPVLSERDNSKIKIDKFEVTMLMMMMIITMNTVMVTMMMMIMLRQVEFKHADAKLDVKGLGGKIIQKLSNSVNNCLKSFL